MQFMIEKFTFLKYCPSFLEASERYIGFNAFLDIQEYYADILSDAHQSPEQVKHEAELLSKKWESDSPSEEKDSSNWTNSNTAQSKLLL